MNQDASRKRCQDIPDFFLQSMKDSGRELLTSDHFRSPRIITLSKLYIGKNSVYLIFSRLFKCVLRSLRRQEQRYICKLQNFSRSP